MGRTPRDARSLQLAEHALVQDALARLRDRRTPTRAFRRAIDELTALLAQEITRDLPLVSRPLSGPDGPVPAAAVETERVAVVAVLRAGLGMLGGVLRLLPDAAVGLVGLRRDPRTKQPTQYFLDLPPDRGGPWLIVDPMIATGGSALRTMELLLRHGVDAQRIRLLAAVVAPEGLQRLAGAQPELRIVAAALDSHLNDAKEIVPGIGDAGDRLFGTQRVTRPA